MEESSKLHTSENKEDTENGKDITESSKRLKDKFDDSLKIPVEIKSNNHNDQNCDENDEISSSLKNFFIIRIYGAISIQLMITLSFIHILNKKTIRRIIIDEYFDEAEDILSYSSIIFVILIILLSLSRNIIKIFPINFFALFAFGLYPIIFFSIIGTLYYFETVFIGVLLTIISSLVISFYIFYTNNDINYLALFILVLLSQVFTTWTILVFKPEKEFYLVCGFILALITGIYLIYDSQLLSEKYGPSCSLNEFIFATLDVYLDAIKFVLKFIVGQVRNLSTLLDKLNSNNKENKINN